MNKKHTELIEAQRELVGKPSHHAVYLANRGKYCGRYNCAASKQQATKSLETDDVSKVCKAEHLQMMENCFLSLEFKFIQEYYFLLKQQNTVVQEFVKRVPLFHIWFDEKCREHQGLG